MLKYTDRVRVKSGFYEGMEGTVIRQDIIMQNDYARITSIAVDLDIIITVKYICELKDPRYLSTTFISDWINESDLEIIK